VAIGPGFFFFLDDGLARAHHGLFVFVSLTRMFFTEEIKVGLARRLRWQDPVLSNAIPKPGDQRLRFWTRLDQKAWS
jgi:hypothetical protein